MQLHSYDNANRVTTIGASGTETDSSLSCNNANRLTTLTHQVSGGALLATYAYGYDPGNRLASESDTSGTYTYNATYTYDAANELTGVSGTNAESYTYDSGGNRTMTGYVTGGDNALTSSPGYTYTYDSEGNLTEKTQTSGGTQVTSYAYDARNRMTGATIRASSGGAIVHQVTYTYDALDRRIGVDTDGTQTWTVYDGQNTYGDFNSSGAVQVRYLYGPAIDAILARTDSGGTSAWYQTDHLGSVRDVVNTSGTVIDHVSYDSFGNTLSESNAANGDRFKFDGMPIDSAIEHYFDNARWYDSGIGRFTSIDPLGIYGGDTNLYRIVGNHPSYGVDKTGLIEYDPNTNGYSQDGQKEFNDPVGLGNSQIPGPPHPDEAAWFELQTQRWLAGKDPYRFPLDQPEPPPSELEYRKYVVKMEMWIKRMNKWYSVQITARARAEESLRHLYEPRNEGDGITIEGTAQQMEAQRERERQAREKEDEKRRIEIERDKEFRKEMKMWESRYLHRIYYGGVLPE